MEVIAFFDLFSYPATAFEIWTYLGIKCDLAAVEKILQAINGRDGIDKKAASYDWADKMRHKNGFYFLRGREEIVDERRKRYNFTSRKFKRALRVAYLFKLIPWIRLMAVGNMLGGNNLKNESDIDIFIITEKKRLWMTRFFCAGAAKLLGLRPTKTNKQDKICLSFYVSEDALDLRELMLDNNIEKNSSEIKFPGFNIPHSAFRTPQLQNDPYFVYWLAGLVPIYDRNGAAYRQFIKANAWLHECMPNWRPVETVKLRNAGQGFNNLYHDVVDLLIGGLETTVKKWQLGIMPKSLKAVMNQGTNVVINDSVLKLYATDKRAEYRENFFKKLSELNI